MNAVPSPIRNELEPLRKAFSFIGLLFMGVIVGGFVVSFLAAGTVYDYEDSIKDNKLPLVEVIVCLAGGKGRISFASEIWYQYWKLLKQNADQNQSSVPILYISGMGKQGSVQKLTHYIKPEILKVLPPKEVIIETFSTNTDENARVFAHSLKEKKWQRVLLITSSYHMKRAKYVFRKILSQANASVQLDTLSFQQEPFMAGKWNTDLQGIQVTMTEFFKLIIYKAFWNVDS